jgi:DNA-binding response OmpR family regulator
LTGNGIKEPQRGEDPMTDKKKVIIIDDEPDIVTYLTTLLEDNGYETIAAKDGQEGLDKTRAQKPDLVLLDITMPEKSGVKYYRELREDADLKSIPVIMVTGVTQDFKKFISTRKQVPPPDGYISKPIDKQLLLDTISKVLAGK